MEKATVYFTNELTPEAVVKMYRQLGVALPGKVAVKVHSGEDGNQNYLRPEFMKPVIDAVNGTVVECNTAYGGARNETPKHIELMKKHHWSDLFDVDIMDAEGSDVQWPVENGKVLKVNYLGKNIENYDSMLVLVHFKGHPMGGYGGALKQLSIGCASSAGKAYIHSGGKVTDQNILWENTAEQDTFLEAMADAASTVTKHFAGKIAYVAVMKNLSVDCDCCAVAEDPCMMWVSCPVLIRSRWTVPALIWCATATTPAASILWSASTAATAPTRLMWPKPSALVRRNTSWCGCKRRL